MKKKMEESENDEKERLDSLRESYRQVGAEFDKQILIIASGALGISLAFIKDIVTLNCATYKTILLLSWISFSLVILCSIISHYTSAKAHNHAIKYLYSEKKKNIYNFITQKLNVLMLVFLVLGLAFLLTFIGINL